MANGGVRQQTAVHAGLHSKLEPIANTNRAQVRQTVGRSAGGIIEAEALSTHYCMFVQSPILAKLTIPTQNSMAPQTGSCTNFCPSAHL